MTKTIGKAYAFEGSSTLARPHPLYIVRGNRGTDTGEEGDETRQETHAKAKSIGGEESQTDQKRIGVEDVRQLVNGMKFAEYLGTPFFAMVTMRWDLMPSFDVARWVPIQTRLLKQVSQWLDYRSVPVAYAWVREVSRGSAPHTHVLMHLPPEYWGVFRRFVVSCGGFVETGPDAPVHVSGGEYGTRTAAMRAGHARYLLKSIASETTYREGGRSLGLAAALGIRSRATGVGVVGKRVGVSRGLDRAARAAAGWREVVALDALRRALNP